MVSAILLFQAHALASGELKYQMGHLRQIKILDATECIVRTKNLKKEACVIMAE